MQAQDPIAAAKRQQPPAIDIATGWEIPSEGYCDQPYVVKLADGTWLCTLTTGRGEEGNTGQHVVSCTSTDRGKTWAPLVDIEPASGPEASWGMPFLTAYGRVYVFYTYNAANLREVIADDDYARKRVDTLGEYALKYSDDGGRTWSPQRWYIPVRATAIDRKNPYQGRVRRSEEHTSELKSPNKNPYAVFCLKKNKKKTTINKNHGKTSVTLK